VLCHASLFYLCEVAEDESVLAGVGLELPGDGVPRARRGSSFGVWFGLAVWTLMTRPRFRR
jgi:hypothetical protein